MKKFAFTNEKYQGFKEKEYDRLKLDMESVDKKIDAVIAVLAQLAARYDDERARFAKACKEGVGAGELINYQGFFEFLQEQIAEGNAEKEKLMEQKRKLTEQLLRVHNELKVLEGMREEQYQAYCKEVAAEEAKDMDTHISFGMIEKAV